MNSRFVVLARSRLLGVGLALVAELCLVSVLTLASAPVEAGIPGVLAAAIAGTVAVVFGVLDGIALALVGAVVFAMIDGWSVGALAALVVWPGVVGAVGLFARRVEQQRDLLGGLVCEQEAERRRAALALYDEKAQTLAGALFMLRAAGHADSEGAAETAQRARDLISSTISELRALSGELSPRALEHQGLASALDQLAEDLSQVTPARIETRVTGEVRLSFESQLALYRLVQDALDCLVQSGEQDIHVGLDADERTVTVSIRVPGRPDQSLTLDALQAHHERLRLLGGHLRISRATDGPLIQAYAPALV